MEEERDCLIAIVDDDESVREATISLLRSNGFRAESFPSADEFLGSPLKTKTGCLLLDIVMPGMSGLELQRRLADEARHISIVFITAQDNQAIRREVMQAGAVDFLVKPFSETALLNAIREALNRAGNNERKIP